MGHSKNHHQAAEKFCGIPVLLYTMREKESKFMSRKTIEKNLVKALLKDGAMTRALFEYELEEHVDEFLQSKREDSDDFFFALTERKDEVAMLLIDNDDKVYVNEEARARLKTFWKGSVYEHNLKMLIPQMADELSKGFLSVNGVKAQVNGK